MNPKVVTVELPASLFEELQEMAHEEQTDPATVIANLITMARRQTSPPGQDPVFGLIGAYQSDRRLIDGIPVSEDPELYIIAEESGEIDAERHAWEIAPARYARGKDGRAVRRDANEAGE